MHPRKILARIPSGIAMKCLLPQSMESRGMKAARTDPCDRPQRCLRRARTLQLIESLHSESATIDQHEFSRAEWFWRRRPGILFTNLMVIFSYLTVAVCLFYSRKPSFYYSPGLVPGLVVSPWITFGSAGGETNTDLVLNVQFISRAENKPWPLSMMVGTLPKFEAGALALTFRAVISVFLKTSVPNPWVIGSRWAVGVI